MGRYGKYYTTKKVALALQAMVRARYPQDSLQMIGFYTFANLLNERQLINSAPKPVSMFDSRIHLRFDLDHPAGRVPQHFTNIHAGPPAGPERPLATPGGEQADHRDHRRRADRAHRGPRGRPDLPARREDRDAHPGRGPPLRQRRHPRLQLRADRGLFLSRPGQLRRGDGPRLARAWPPTARPTRSATSSSRASSAADTPSDSTGDVEPGGRRPQPSGLSSSSFSRSESGVGRRGSQDSSTRPTSIMSRMWYCPCLGTTSASFSPAIRGRRRGTIRSPPTHRLGVQRSRRRSDPLSGVEDMDGIPSLRPGPVQKHVDPLDMAEDEAGLRQSLLRRFEVRAIQEDIHVLSVPHRRLIHPRDPGRDRVASDDRVGNPRCRPGPRSLAADALALFPRLAPSDPVSSGGAGIVAFPVIGDELMSIVSQGYREAP